MYDYRSNDKCVASPTYHIERNFIGSEPRARDRGMASKLFEGNIMFGEIEKNYGNEYIKHLRLCSVNYYRQVRLLRKRLVPWWLKVKWYFVLLLWLRQIVQKSIHSIATVDIVISTCVLIFGRAASHGLLSVV